MYNVVWFEITPSQYRHSWDLESLPTVTMTMTMMVAADFGTAMDVTPVTTDL
jgi:hypothetical protein